MGIFSDLKILKSAKLRLISQITIVLFFVVFNNIQINDTRIDYLDKILELIIDKNYDLQSIKKCGFNEKLIKKIWNMLKNAEFKRYQSAIGPKISSMSFDKDRRFPITNKFKI